jgi:hypothetical protein
MLQIGNHLYRIHSHFFYRESLEWRQMLDAPTDGGDHGTTDAPSPFTLNDVKGEDFDRFLWVIYNPYVRPLSCCPYSHVIPAIIQYMMLPLRHG